MHSWLGFTFESTPQKFRHHKIVEILILELVAVEISQPNALIAVTHFDKLQARFENWHMKNFRYTIHTGEEVQMQTLARTKMWPQSQPNFNNALISECPKESKVKLPV